MKLSSLVTLLFAVATLTPLACKSSKPTSDNADAVDSSRLCRVTFNGDSAMNYARAQCDFGPRTPNSAALKKCGDYIVGRFKALELTVTEQRTTVTGWDGKQLGCRNIIAAFHPERKDRVVIAAHYDSRPWAEKDADSSRHHTPVMAADDGASGVAVLLEVARHLTELNPKIGVDLVCFDAEDYGAPYWAPENKRDDESTFCLGSQYWSKQLAADYKPRYGILLDMVGGKDNRFYFEGFSLRYAQPVVTKVWDAARLAGAGDYFVQESGGFITDDHLPMNNIGGIPTIDVIAFTPDTGFPAHWHTTGDTMDKLSPNTLRAVGQTLLQVLSEEK